MSKDDNPNATLGEAAQLRETAIEVPLPEALRALRDYICARFPACEPHAFRGELTLVVPREELVEVLAFCRDDERVRCELLSDLAGVHWPGGTVEINAQETTGWPTYSTEQEGRIEVDYLLTSLTHGHWLRLRVFVPDDAPELPSATGVYRSANIMEREAFDFFGIVFHDHPNLTRVLMPDEWEGFPHRKDYPLGGVDVQFVGATIPPPDERDY